MPRLQAVHAWWASSTSGHNEADIGARADAHARTRRRSTARRRRERRAPQAATTSTARAQVARELAAALPRELYGYRLDAAATPNLFRAVQIEKRMMFIILTLIIAVAAFNLVSTLVMVVTDKQADIAILRTLGAAPALDHADLHGAGRGDRRHRHAGRRGRRASSSRSTSTSIVPAIEHALPRPVPVARRVPHQRAALATCSRATSSPIALIALALAFVATLYPSWRAARVNPAEALRYE